MKKLWLLLLLPLLSCGPGQPVLGPAPLTNHVLSQVWTPQWDHMAAYWNMDAVNTKDNADFFSEFGANGVIVNPSKKGLRTVPGVSGTALAFNGLDSYIRINYRPELNAPKFTVSLWMRPAGWAQSTQSILTSEDNSPTRGYAIYLGPNNQIFASLGQQNANWGTVFGMQALPYAWTHIAITYDDTRLSLYVNGNPASSVVMPYHPNLQRPLYIGAGGTEWEPNAKSFFAGEIDEVGFWSAVLTADEVQTIFKHQTP